MLAGRVLDWMDAIRYDMSVSSFYVENFGCRATQADGAAIEAQFRAQGMKRAGAPWIGSAAAGAPGGLDQANFA